MTGNAPSGPMSPSPSTAVPSVTIATDDPFAVSVHADSGRTAIAEAMRATPGV